MKRRLIDILHCRRFDIHLHLHLPDGKARERIIVDLLTAIPLQYDRDDSAMSDCQRVANHIARQTESWTALNIKQVFQEAAIATLRSNIDARNVPIDQVIRSFDSLAVTR